MNSGSLNERGILRNLGLRSRVALAVAGCMVLPLTGLGAVPTPVVNIGFTEPVGAWYFANTGSLGGEAWPYAGDGTVHPMLVALAPQGPFAPSNNARSLDMGMIETGQGDRAVDLYNPLGTLGAFPNGFTLTGWMNARSLTGGSGGNRILFALQAPNGPGFDLVQLSDGSLQLGVNQWPDGSPAQSSAGKVTADPELGAGNWVFFAVSYDHTLASDQVRFYFGRGDTLAALDVARTYAGGPVGPVEVTGLLTIGNFGEVVVGARSATGGASRVFRGLIDEVKVFDQVLDLAQIQAAQLDGAVPAVPATITRHPQNQTMFAGRDAVFDVVASGTAPILYQWQTNGVDVAGATSSTLVLPAVPADLDGLDVRVRVSNAGMPEPLFSGTATLTVIKGTGRPVFVSFSDLTNRGDLGGSGTRVVTDGYPDYSSQVPVGSHAPAGNTVSMDFGAIDDGQGGRAIDFNNLQYGGTMGQLAQFTFTGWLNARDLSIGSGGNRIAFALAAANGPGFDLVHLADGSLRLGVNQWPDGAGGGGPMSSPGLITADPDAGAANWVFVAVTYDGTAAEQNTAFYRGTANQAAQFDLVGSYNRGPIVTSGPLTLGNFGTVVGARTATGPTGSRVFRGLMDEIQVFDRVLSLAEIQEAQMTAVQVVVDKPRIEITVEQGSVVLSWKTTSVFQLLARDNLITGDWTPVAVAPTVNGNQHTVTLPIEAGVRFLQLRRP